MEQDDPDAPNNNRKRKLTSPIWQEFRDCKDKDGIWHSQCIHCKKLLKKYKDGATSPLIRHLKKCTKRPDHLKQQTLMFSSGGAGESSLSGVGAWKYDADKVRTIMSHMLMVHELPFAFVEYDVFNILMKTIAPQY